MFTFVSEMVLVNTVFRLKNCFGLLEILINLKRVQGAAVTEM